MHACNRPSMHAWNIPSTHAWKIPSMHAWNVPSMHAWNIPRMHAWNVPGMRAWNTPSMHAWNIPSMYAWSIPSTCVLSLSLSLLGPPLGVLVNVLVPGLGCWSPRKIVWAPGPNLGAQTRSRAAAQIWCQASDAKSSGVSG